MSLFSSSLRGLMIAVLYAAIGLTALRNASERWVIATFLLALLLPVGALLTAWIAKGRARAFWLGFGLCGWGALIIFLGKSTEVALIPDLPTVKLFDLLFPQLGPPPTPLPPHDLSIHGPPEYVAFQAIGHALLALLLGVIGGAIARTLASHFQPPEPQAPKREATVET
jgi:hypothetical protein